MVAVKSQRIVLKAEQRSSLGGRSGEVLRAANKLPAVVYGLTGGNVSVALGAPETEKAVHSGAHLVDLEIAGKLEHVLIQDVQYNYLQTKIEHVDFLRIDPTREVKVKVPLEFRGIPKGAKEGGILEVQHTEIEVMVLPLQIPDSLRVNVEHLELDGVLHARELSLPEGLRMLNPPEQIICQVRAVKEIVPEVDATAVVAAGPEVIGKKPAEGEAVAAGAAGAAPAADKKAPAKK